MEHAYTLDWGQINIWTGYVNKVKNIGKKSQSIIFTNIFSDNPVLGIYYQVILALSRKSILILVLLL